MDEAAFPLRSGRALLALSLLATLAAGCSHPQSAANTLEREVPLSSGSFFEANLAMNATDTIAYRWFTSPDTELAFDVHSHEGGELRYHERTNASRGEGAFTAPEDGVYSLLWENPAGESVTVSFRIDGDFALDSTAP